MVITFIAANNDDDQLEEWYVSVGGELGGEGVHLLSC